MEYDETNEPTTFRLIFTNCVEVLQAETPDEASDWVEKIVEGEYHAYARMQAMPPSWY